MRTAADEEREDLWAESVRRFDERRREENRVAWREHFERMRAVHGRLADEYAAKLERLEETA